MMVKIYSSENPANVHLARSFLEGHGIACEVRNEYTSMGRGELPPIQCWPELWVPQDQVEWAEQLLQEAQQLEASGQDSWVCPKCGETVEGQFGACWNCGAQAPQTVDSGGKP